jgi:hypothetical protein
MTGGSTGAGAGAVAAAALTCTLKAGSVAVRLPSLTAMTMFEYVPTFAVVGVPDSWPLLLEKVAHDGRFEIAKTSVRGRES